MVVVLIPISGSLHSQINKNAKHVNWPYLSWTIEYKHALSFSLSLSRDICHLMLKAIGLNTSTSENF